MAEKSWYQTGKQGEERSKHVEEEMQSRFGPPRFWLKPPKSAHITFLDTEGFHMYEHNLYRGGQWGNYFTCIQDFDNCPLDESGDRPSYVAVFTIIDHSEYVSQRTGKKIKNVKKLLVLKPRAFNKVKLRRETQKGNLTHCIFKVTRGSNDECATGEDFEFLGRTTKEKLMSIAPQDPKLQADWLKPFDYMKIFEPKDATFLRQLVGTKAPVGSDDALTPDADIPASDAPNGTRDEVDDAIEGLL